MMLQGVSLNRLRWHDGPGFVLHLHSIAALTALNTGMESRKT
jgi:hypothetical protein